MAVARQVGLALPETRVLTGPQLPADDESLGELIDRDGAVRFVHARYEAGTDERIASQVASLLE